jgi:hypothetical protein
MGTELSRLKEKMSKARQELSALLLTSFENWFREQEKGETMEVDVDPASSVFHDHDHDDDDQDYESDGK